MTGQASGSVADHELASRYEELRRYALCAGTVLRPSRYGLALLVRCGMADGVIAQHECGYGDRKTTSRPAAGTGPAQTELVTFLTELVLSRWRKLSKPTTDTSVS